MIKKYYPVFIAIGLLILGIVLIQTGIIHQKAERVYDITRHRNISSILESKTLIVGTTINPISFYYHGDAKAGFEYEIVQHIAKKLKVKLQIVKVANDSTLYSMIRKGQIDLAMNHFLSLENNYTKDFEYTSDIMKTHVTMISFSNHDTAKNVISNKLKYSKIYIPTKDFEHLPKDYILKLLPEHSTVYFDDTSSSFGLMSKLNNRDSTILITWDYLYQLSNLNEIHSIKSQDIPTDNQMTFILARNNNTLLDTVNVLINQFKSTAKYTEICKRYLSNAELLTLSEEEMPIAATKLKYKRGAISIYDEYIKKYAKQNKLDWRLVAAVIQKESGFNTHAESPYGASGLMQLMPETGKKFGADSLFNPEQNIKAGCMYLKYLTNYWSKKVNDSTQVIYFVLASYNSGQGHIIDAQNLATKYKSNPNIWFDHVELYLSLKRDPTYYNDPVCKLGFCRATETINFVKNVSARYRIYSETIK